MNSGKTNRRKAQRNSRPRAERFKKAAQQNEVKPPTWEEVAKYPLVMYNTLGRGIIIGLFGGTNESIVRVYAPACILEVPPSNISFLPLFPVEHFMDLRQACIFSSSPIPVILAQGYLGYFEQFCKGSYKLQPVVINAAIDAPEGVHTIPGKPEPVRGVSEER